MTFHNPFTIQIVETTDDFCNRTKELTDLTAFARNGENVVLFSPRRFGKSSLVMMVQKTLQKEGMLTAYIDLFPIASKKDLIQRLAHGFFKGIGRGIQSQSWIDKIKGLFKHIRPVVSVGEKGLDFSIEWSPKSDMPILLEDLLTGMHAYIEKNKLRAQIALDEFQEITELEESKEIEGILRSCIQTQRKISYYFVGSRRRILNDMFNNKNRPFYKSAFNYPLAKISAEAFVPFIEKQFLETEKKCSEKIAALLYETADGYPYYIQKLAYLLWEITDREAETKGLETAYQNLLEIEKTDFEAIWSGLSLGQRSLLKTLALEPVRSPYSKSYLEKHGLSLGGTQKAMEALLSKDLIEEGKNGFQLVDPIMAAWLKS